MANQIQVTANGQPYPIVEGASIPDFLKQLNLIQQNVVIELNQKALTQKEANKIILTQNDSLEIIKIVAGG